MESIKRFETVGMTRRQMMRSDNKRYMKELAHNEQSIEG